MKTIKLASQKLVSVILTVLTTFIISCEFEPTEKYEAPIQDPSGTQPINTVFPFTSDTIRIYWGEDVKIYLEAGDLDIVDVKYQLNNFTNHASLGMDNYITIGLSYNEPGITKFRIIVFARTGTGSIGDKLGVEFFQYISQEFTVIFGPPDVDHNLYSYIDDDGLHLVWKKYDGPTSVSYRLKNISTGVTYNVNGTSYLFSEYAGQQYNYEVYVVRERRESLWGKCQISKSASAVTALSIRDSSGSTFNFANTLY
jgi:hypothetical protein